MANMKTNKKIINILCALLFIAWLSGPVALANKVVKNIDYLYMHIGLQMDYPLPEEFRKEQLKFEGNYKRWTSAVYRKDKNEIRFTPKRVGSAMLIIKNKKNKIIGRLSIDIQKDNLHKIAAELRDLLVAVDGIEIKIYNKKVVIDGQILFPKEMARIQAVKAQYGDIVQVLVTYSPLAQKKIASTIEKEIGYPEMTVRYAYNRFLLEGCVSSQEEYKRAQSIANLYTQFDLSPVGDQASRRPVYIVKNDLTIPCESDKKDEEEKAQKSEIKKLIQIVVHFVEMNKSFGRGFSFQWSPAINTGGTQINASIGNQPGIPRGITSVLTATVANFFPKLNWAKKFNFARVLHNSSVLVQNEETGTISMVTTVPDKVSSSGDKVSGGAQSAVTTAIKPRITGERDNLVQMGVNVTVSAPDGKGGVTQKSINTTIHVQDSYSAVLGGIISSHLIRSYNDPPRGGVEAGLPLLDLISAKNYSTQKSQFVVFITPLIKSSSSLGVERIKRKFRLDE